MSTLPRSHGSAILIAFSSFAFKQIPLRLQVDATAATSRCHCGYKQIPLRRQADVTAATSRCHCGYKQMPLRQYTVNKTADRPNIRYHSCPTSSNFALRMRACSPIVDIRVLYEYSPIVDLANSSTAVSAPESRPALFWPAPP